MSQNRYQLPGEKNWTQEIEAKCARPVQDGVQTVKSHGIRNGYYIMNGTRIVSVLLRRTQLSFTLPLLICHLTIVFIFTKYHQFTKQFSNTWFYFRIKHIEFVDSSHLSAIEVSCSWFLSSYTPYNTCDMNTFIKSSVNEIHNKSIQYKMRA